MTLYFIKAYYSSSSSLSLFHAVNQDLQVLLGTQEFCKKTVKSHSTAIDNTETESAAIARFTKYIQKSVKTSYSMHDVV